MNKKKYILILILLSAFIFDMCSSDDEWDIKFCPGGCPSATPWRVESLDIGLPCFSTKDECLAWAATHGYSDGTCIKCQ